MKTVFMKHPLLQVSTLLVTATCAVLFALPMGSVARAETFFTLRELLGSHFRDSASVSYDRVHPSGPLRAAIQHVGGEARDEYVVYIARSAERVDGYALVDQERGQHELIDVATFFDADGRVTDVEVMAYREAYGDSIRSTRFRRQFVGRDANSGFSVGRDIDVVSGATLSSGAMARAVARAALIVRAELEHQATVAPR